jgi:hypothetical protein
MTPTHSKLDRKQSGSSHSISPTKYTGRTVSGRNLAFLLLEVYGLPFQSISKPTKEKAHPVSSILQGG